MDPQDLLKALFIHAAYTGAVAVCEPLISNPDGTQVKLDPLIQDLGLQNKGVLVYEEAKVQYAAILRAFSDKTGVWPDPTPTSAPVTTVPQNATEALTAVQNILKALPSNQLSSAASAILGVVQGLAAQAAPPAPPGSDIPASAAPTTTSAKAPAGK
jgi:hypothetical protein